MKALKLSASEGLDTESGTASYDPSVEMDVDLTYNTDEQNGTCGDLALSVAVNLLN